MQCGAGHFHPVRQRVPGTVNAWKSR
jgi:hypothetical protein